MHFKTFRFCIHATVLIPGAEHRPVVVWGSGGGGGLRTLGKGTKRKKAFPFNF